MKPFLFALALFTGLFISCSAIDDKPFDEIISQGVNSQNIVKTRADRDDFQVHLEDALRYAKLVEPRKKVERIVPFVKDRDTLMYYVYYNDGWKLISGDKRIQPELINEPKGKRTPEELCDGEKITVQEYVEFLSALKDYPYADKDTQHLNFWNKIQRKKKQAKEDFKTRTVWEPTLYDYPWLFHKIVCEDDYPSYIVQLYYSSINHLVNARWGQGDSTHPWNNKIPVNSFSQRPPLGCVSVAVSQLLYYLHQEKNLDLGLYEDVVMDGYYTDYSQDVQEYFFHPSLTKSQYDQSSTRWDNMPTDANGSSTSMSYAQDLMLVVGQGVNMFYTIDESSSNIINTKSYLSTIGINCTKSYYNSDIIVPSIQNGFPVYARASNSQGGGHAFLIDGYHIKESRIYEYYRWEKVYPSDPDFSPVYGDDYLTPDEVANLGYEIYDGQEGYFLAETSYPEYLMINWGYDGLGHGSEYFNSDSASWPIGSTNYTYNKQILYNFSFPTR